MGINEHYELVKEYHFSIDGIEPKIKARILKIILGVNAKFTWETNYYCRLEDEMDVYIPSAPFGQTLAETELKMTRYIERFSQAVDIRENPFF